jgi:colicin import membrane protein
MTFRLPHLVAAVTLHVLLLALLVGGVQCSIKPHAPTVINAVLLDPSRAEQARRQRDEKKSAEQRRQAEADRKRREQEAQQKRVAEQKAAEQKKAEQQKRAQVEAEARKKKDAEALQQKQLAEKRAADQKAAEQKKAEEAARRKREADEKAEQAAAARRDAAEQARVQQAMQEEALKREADLEQRARAESEREARQSEWGAQLTEHIRRNVRWPPNTPDDYACQVSMQLLPDGTVTSAKIVKSCGSAPLDRAVEDAVYRSSPMPRPADPGVFDRDVLINFNARP